jgi:hypothetical protein
MKIYVSILFIITVFICNISFAFSDTEINNVKFKRYRGVDTLINPLLKYSEKWNDKKFKSCITFEGVNYLNEEEKKVIWVLNMIRLDPQLFIKTVLLNPQVMNTWRCPEYYTLIADVKKLKPDSTSLLPDSLAFVSARCHATQSGNIGYVGHSRQAGGCVKDFWGECCEYGSNNAFDILMNLLVDSGIYPPGHRYISLSPNYSKLGVSIQPHKSIYRVNTVMDFK